MRKLRKVLPFALAVCFAVVASPAFAQTTYISDAETAVGLSIDGAKTEMLTVYGPLWLTFFGLSIAFGIAWKLRRMFLATG